MKGRARRQETPSPKVRVPSGGCEGCRQGLQRSWSWQARGCRENGSSCRTAHGHQGNAHGLHHHNPRHPARFTAGPCGKGGLQVRPVSHKHKLRHRRQEQFKDRWHKGPVRPQVPDGIPAPRTPPSLPRRCWERRCYAGVVLAATELHRTLSKAQLGTRRMKIKTGKDTF